jgi:PKD repeat protein
VSSNSLNSSGYTWILDSASNTLLTGSGSSTAGDKNVKFSTAGFKTVGLIVTDNNGCKDTSWGRIQIKSHPDITSISITNTGLCLNNHSVTFIPRVTWVTKKSKFSWDKDFASLANRKENSTDSVLSKVTYLSSGNKKAHLIVTDANGCTDTLEKQLFINPIPKASLIIDTSLQCRNNNAIRLVSNSAKATGTSKKLGYAWSFDPSANGVSAATTDSVLLRYTSIGRKTFDFIAIDSNSCRDTLKGSFQIRELPSATVSVTNGTQCLVTNKFELNPSVTWRGGSGTIDWFFNAPTTTSNIYDTSIIKPIVRYRNIGIKPVQLRLKDANGCKDTIKLNLTVRPNPRARFDIANDTQCLQGNEFSFDATKSRPTSGDSAISTYSWNFNGAKINGDVVPTTSAILNPDSVVFSSAGLKKISLIVTNNFGCSDTSTQSTQVNPKPFSEWKLTLQKNCYRNHIFSFEGKGTPVSGSSIKSYNWDFGFGAIPSDSSGNSATIPKIDSVFYTSIGSKTVTLTVTDNNGCLDTFSSKVNVFGHPDARIRANRDNQCLNENNFNLSGKGSFSSTSSNINQFTWNLGRNVIGSKTRNGDSLSNIKYSKSGFDTLLLITTDLNNCSDTAYKIIEIKPNPIAKWRAVSDSVQCLEGNEFSFSASSSTASQNSRIISYTWDFGPNSNTRNVYVSNPQSIVFNKTGKHAVKLTVTDSNGCEHSLIKNIEIRENPIALISAVPDVACFNNNRFNFVSNSKQSSLAPLKKYYWTFNSIASKNIDSTKNVNNISYTDTGYQMVKLVVVDSLGCTDTAEKNVYVKGSPRAFITNNNLDTQCLDGNRYVFNALNSQAVKNSSIKSYSWTFGLNANIANSTKQSPDTLSYTKEGNKTIVLVITDSNGCNDTAVESIFIGPKPTANWITNDVDICYRNQSFNVSARGSKGINGAALNSNYTYNWSFGPRSNIGTATGDTVSGITFDTIGNQRVVLTISDKTAGCSDTFGANLRVLDHPNAIFRVVKDSQCLDKSYTFNAQNSTAVVNSNLKSYSWDFGNSAKTKTASVAVVTNIGFNSSG